MITLHAAPRAVGSGDGATPGSAADYVDDAFWDRVQATLEDSAVTVSLTGDAGDYTRGRLPLLGRGHQDRALVIDGGAEPGAVMRVEPGGESGILVRDAVNITIRGVTFSGPGEIGYVTLVQSSHRIRFEGCAWVDLPGVVYGASGVHRAGSRDVLYSECVFRRVGTRPSAHMIYNANHSRQIRLVGCTFEDCSGDYVRFRNGIDECMVVGCVFASGGDYPPSAPVSRPFVAVPTFNDVDPGDETFGTHFVLARNRFTYAGAATEGHRRVLSFHHSGFDPPGRHHLMTAAEGHTLEHGTVAERRRLLDRNCGIDPERVIVYGNRRTGADSEVTFTSITAYDGVESRGWEGTVDITDLLNRDPVIEVPPWLPSVLAAVDT